MNWRYFVAGVIIGLIVLLIFPLKVLHPFLHDDSVAHLLSGVSLTLLGASVLPRTDDALLITVGIMGFVWEPTEAWYFGVDLVSWFERIDTIKDITQVALGSALTLIGIERYK